MDLKTFEIETKEAQGETPGLIAYASTFDRVPDAYGDVIAPGAFNGTLKRLEESGNKLPLLYGHVMDDPANIIGTVTKAEEDEKGLRIEAAWDMENPKAQQVRRAVLAKSISKLSFAFTVLDSGPVKLEDGTQANELRELEIYEVSLVVVPANQFAQVVGAKDAPAEEKEAPAETPEIEADGPEAVCDTDEPEPEEVKAEEPMEVKAEEPAEVEEEPEPETVNPIPEKENIMEIETMNAIASAAPAEKGLREVLTETFVGKGLKDGGRFSVATPEIKAFVGTPQWIPTVSRNVAGIGPDYTFADLLGQETISGNAYTFVQIAVGENGAEASEVAEGGEKPLLEFDPLVNTIPLTKVAGYLHESDELLEDADWLVSALETRGVRAIRKARDGKAAGEIGGTQGIGNITQGGVTEANILQAITDIKGNTGLNADAIVVAAADYVTLVSAALSANHSLFGPDYKSILGVPVYVDNATIMPSGTALVGAFKDGATLVQKGGTRVEMSNSDQDDFIHNLVKVRIEQRLAVAVREPAAFVKIGTGQIGPR